MLVKTVVEEVANFPFYLPCPACLRASQKRPRTGQNTCKITWGYVARLGWGGGEIPRAIIAGLRFSGSKNLSGLGETDKHG